MVDSSAPDCPCGRPSKCWNASRTISLWSNASGWGRAATSCHSASAASSCNMHAQGQHVCHLSMAKGMHNHVSLYAAIHSRTKTFSTPIGDLGERLSSLRLYKR